MAEETEEQKRKREEDEKANQERIRQEEADFAAALQEQRLQEERDQSRTAQTVQLADKAAQVASVLPDTLPTQGPVVSPRVLPEGVSRLSNPQGRMYMGPAPGEALVPPGLAYSAMTPDSGVGAAGRVAAATAPQTISAPLVPPERLAAAQAMDQPGSRTISIRNEAPYSDETMRLARARSIFELNQKMSQGGQLTAEEIQAAMGQPVGLSRGLGREMTANQAARNAMEAQKIEMARQKLNAPKVIPPETITETVKYDAVQPQIGQPEIPGRSGLFGLGARPPVPATPDIPGQPARTITRKVPVETTPIEQLKETKKVLTKAKAAEFKQRAKGNRAKAEEMARAEGYEF
jgi:type II secretory pathway pseudopilin PulG